MTHHVQSMLDAYPKDLGQVDTAKLAACIEACADECEQHADMHEHCRICAEACRACEKACNELVDALG